MKLITFGSSFLSPEELTLLVTLLLMAAGFLIVIGFRKAGLAMLVSVLILAFLPIFDPFLDSIFSLLPDWAFWLLIVFLGLAVFRWVLEFFIGKKEANSAIGNLVISAIKSIITTPFRMLRYFFSRL